MSFQENRSPFHYDFLKLKGPYASDILQDVVDPNRRLRSVNIDFQDNRVHRFYLSHIFDDLANVNDMRFLHQNLVRVYENLKKTHVYQHIGFTFEPDPSTESLKVTIAPKRPPRLSFDFSDFIMGDTYGLGGSFKMPNALGLLDTLAWNLAFGVHGPITGSSSLIYTLPLLYKDYGLSLTLAGNHSNLSTSISEKNSFKAISLTHKNYLFKVLTAHRTNYINRNTHPDSSLKDIVDLQEFLPSRKLSFSAQRYWNHINPDQTVGNRLILTGEAGLVENLDRFVKFRVKNNSFYEIKPKNFPGGEVVFENFFDFGVAYPMSGSKLRINDRHFKNRIRGFSYIRNRVKPTDANLTPLVGTPEHRYLSDYNGDDLYLKNSVKVTLNEKMEIFNTDFLPFLHFSYGYFAGNVFNRQADERLKLDKLTKEPESRWASVPWLKDAKNKSRFSFGVGLTTRFNPLVNCEFLLNLYSIGQPNDSAQRLQIHMEF